MAISQVGYALQLRYLFTIGCLGSAILPSATAGADELAGNKLLLTSVRAQAERFQVPHHYPHIDEMLAGEPFEFLINLTDMQEHERLNRQALQSGKHVWSEKPIANSLAAGQQLLGMAKQKGKPRCTFWRLWPLLVNRTNWADAST